MDKQLAKVALALAGACGTSAFAETFSAAVKRADYNYLTTLSIKPEKYADAETLKKDLVLANFFKKAPFDNGVDVKKVAEDKFLRFEQHCAVTNSRFHRFMNCQFNDVDEMSLDTFLSGVRKRVRRALGPIPDTLSWGFGKGATFETSGLCCTVADKIENTPSCTSGLTGFLPFWWETKWGRVVRDRQSIPEVVRGNRFTTVPKTAKEDRGIAIEPSLNVSAQLPIGKLIRRRLGDVLHIDLLRGQQFHRELVDLASRDGSLATLDLTGASDTVAHLFVKYLVPAEWYELLNSCRSQSTLFRGKWHRLEKFSSMGNGFTFELETLLFKCLMDELASVYGVSEQAVYVYGDDIIVPTAMAKGAISLLSCCGFILNKDKSFIDGSFRESCGGDFFNGVNVRTHYVEKIPTEPSDWIALANGIRRMAHLEPSVEFRGHPYYPAWCRCLDAIPVHIRRLRGPTSLGDIVIHDDDSAWRQNRYAVFCEEGIDGTIRRSRDGLTDEHVSEHPDLGDLPRALGLRIRPGRNYKPVSLFRIPVYTPVSRKVGWEHFTGDVALATIVAGFGDSRGLTPRGQISGFRVTWAYVQ